MITSRMRSSQWRKLDLEKRCPICTTGSSNFVEYFKNDMRHLKINKLLISKKITSVLSKL